MKLLILLSLLIASCQTAQVRTQDLHSWEGEPASLLDKHPYFSTLQREDKTLYNGETVINFTQKRLIPSGSGRCFGVSSGFGFGPGSLALGTDNCGPRQYVEDNCLHQFVVNESLIQSYNVLGSNCSTSCQQTPQAKKCEK